MIEHSKEVSQELSKLLAESYTLYLKTHNYHWNVTGPMFHSLHLLFEQQYTELATAVDTIAERIRALGDKAPGSYAAFARLSSVKDAEGEPDATEMLKTLTADGFREYANGQWRADELTMTNQLTGGTSILRWREIEFDNGFTERDFSVDALKRVR